MTAAADRNAFLLRVALAAVLLDLPVVRAVAVPVDAVSATRSAGDSSAVPAAAEVFFGWVILRLPRLAGRFRRAGRAVVVLSGSMAIRSPVYGPDG